MGWLFKSGCSRRALIEQRTQDWERTTTEGVLPARRTACRIPIRFVKIRRDRVMAVKTPQKATPATQRFSGLDLCNWGERDLHLGPCEQRIPVPEAL
jgi:hypothetical protein